MGEGLTHKDDMMKIDFVVTWLDSGDPQWQAEYAKYKSQTTGRTEAARFRNWELFKYWFRAVEAYAPWVNKVFLITNGKFPDWINENHPKLVLVCHSDYIPERFLPTFNSRTIEMFLHRIPGLSEFFVYFNDDCYLNAPITPKYYFRNGLPCDCNLETCLNVPTYTKADRFDIYMSMLADIGVINAHFNRYKTVRKSLRRWYGMHLGLKGILFSLLIGKKRKFVGFECMHWEHPLLKSTFEELWSYEPDLLESSCTSFREEMTLNPYVFRYWQFASNKFYPVKANTGRMLVLIESHIDKIASSLNDSRIKSLCLNDVPKCSEAEFIRMRDIVQSFFVKKFPGMSSYEKCS